MLRVRLPRLARPPGTASRLQATAWRDRQLFSSATSATTTAPQAAPKKIALIPGDGIGKEVVPEAERLLKALAGHVSVSFVRLDAGFETFEKTGNALPPETLAALREQDAAIFGAVSSPSHKVPGYSSPIVAMRTALDLYANLRPSFSAPSVVKGTVPGVDLLIVRENTECLYVKKERLEGDSPNRRAIAERHITEKASTRIATMAFEQARARAAVRVPTKRAGRHRPPQKASVTVVHKSNVLSVTDGLFRECALEVAKKYPDITVQEQLVDSMLYKMIRAPHDYDVIVAPNLYGDILSDGAAALVGGLGLAPSSNTGDNFCMVEPVHGSAPDIAGKGIANPVATMLAVGMLMNHFKLPHLSDAIRAGCYEALRSGYLTPDLHGDSNTRRTADAVIKYTLGALANVEKAKAKAIEKEEKERKTRKTKEEKEAHKSA